MEPSPPPYIVHRPQPVRWCKLPLLDIYVKQEVLIHRDLDRSSRLAPLRRLSVSMCFIRHLYGRPQACVVSVSYPQPSLTAMSRAADLLKRSLNRTRVILRECRPLLWGSLWLVDRCCVVYIGFPLRNVDCMEPLNRQMRTVSRVRLQTGSTSVAYPMVPTLRLLEAQVREVLFCSADRPGCSNSRTARCGSIQTREIGLAFSFGQGHCAFQRVGAGNLLSRPSYPGLFELFGIGQVRNAVADRRQEGAESSQLER